MRYCGVVTPFRGVRVYARSAMGMPGSETALEELLCRILGDLLQEGSVAKLADDIYCGGNTIVELQQNVKRQLQCFANSGLRLSATKTTICPTSTTILGWIWNMGTIQASPHRIATLASCEAPTTVKAMRWSLQNASACNTRLLCLTRTFRFTQLADASLLNTSFGQTRYGRPSSMHRTVYIRTRLSRCLDPPTSYGL